MTRQKIAVLLIVLSLLISAAKAHAECAWVLWSQETVTDSERPPSRYGEFRRIVAVETRAECVKAAKTRAEEGRDTARRTGHVLGYAESRSTGLPMRPPESLNADADVAWRDGSKAYVTAYTCLPDTVDPRGGVKGGAR